MSGKLQGLRDNEIYYRSSAALSRSEIPGQSAGVSGVSEAEASVPKSPSLEHPSNDSCVAAEPICMLSSLLLNSKNEEARIERSIHLYRVFCPDISHGHTSQLSAGYCSGCKVIRYAGDGAAT